MPEPRLTAEFWVRAYLRRLEMAMIPAYLTARGDAQAGAVLVRVDLLDGRAKAFHRIYDPLAGARHWDLLAEGAEAEVGAAIARQRRYDPDLWVIEIEDRTGRTLLEEPGLAE